MSNGDAYMRDAVQKMTDVMRDAIGDLHAQVAAGEISRQDAQWELDT